MTRTQYIWAALAVIIIAIIGLFMWHGRANAPTVGEATTTAVHVALGGVGDVATKTAAYTIEQVHDIPQNIKNIEKPNFKAAVSCSLTAEACDKISSQATDVVKKLGKNANDLWAWIDLGTLRKVTGDYKGAAEDWEYVSAEFPTNPTSFSNLGDLYMNYLHNEPKAEKSYLKAIENYPQNIDAYRALFALYAGGYAPEKAEPLMLKGIKNNPNVYELRVLLARYYKTHGRTADAKAQFQAAADAATKAGHADTAASIIEEMGK